MSANIYYVYIYIDPRNNQPFYVGKGKGDRYKVHLNETKTTTINIKKYHKIQKILGLGLTPIIQFHTNNVDEETAYRIEEELIMKYGRKDLDVDGILTNVCIGNSPPDHTGIHRSEESKKKYSNSKVGSLNPMYGMTGVMHPFYNRQHSSESKLKMQLAQQARDMSGTNNPMYGRSGDSAPSRIHAKRFNFIDKSGIIETNITAVEMSKKYPELYPDKLRKLANHTYKAYKGWTVLD